MPEPTETKTSTTQGRAMRVLVLATSYPLGDDDNSSVFLRYLYKYLGDQGIEPHIVVPAFKQGGHQIENGIHVYRFRYFFRPFQRLCYGSGILSNLKQNPLLWLLVPVFGLAFMIATIRVAMNVRPALIHGHWFIPTGLIGLVASKLVRVPFVITAHGGDAFSINSAAMRWLKSVIARNADAWTANTATTSRAILANGEPVRCRIIPMGIDRNIFSPAVNGADRPAAGENFRILFIGRLVQKKGVEFLLRALSMLPDTLAERVEVDVVGDGNEMANLQRLATTLDILARVNFVGSVVNNRLPSYLQKADLFVGPSIVDAVGDTEGQGVVFLEAMACKVCVIATDVGGISDVIVDGETGLLVPPADPRALASAIEKLLLDGETRQRLAQRGYDLVKQKYDWSGIAGDFKQLYSELLS